MSRTTAIIQARTQSTRLPNKVLLKLQGKAILDHVIDRVLHARSVEHVIVATTVAKADLAIVQHVSRRRISLYCGSEEDVLDRYYQAARLFEADPVIRITADCPVMDFRVINQVVGRYLKTKADYCSNILEETFPDGQDVEVFSFGALERAWTEAKLGSEREHVTPYMKKRGHQFRQSSCVHRPNWGRFRWTVDEKADLAFMKSLFRYLYPGNPFFGMDDIVRFLESHPEVQAINERIMRNEGYLASRARDQGTITG